MAGMVITLCNKKAALGSVILVILFCGSSATVAVGGTKSGSLGKKEIGDDDQGICKLMVELHGYSCEEHTVTTQDGYILSLQKIPVKAGGNGTPILLQHGLLMDGITWLLLPPNESLALVLADNGYEVWVANTRGTKYSRAHNSLTPDDDAYWDWSWDELVAYDLSATIQYVHDQTGQQLHYVGHSLGTLIALAGLSKGVVARQVLRCAALLCPISYMGQITSPLAKKVVENNIAEFLYKSGINEFDLRGDAVVKLLKQLCQGKDCTDLLTAFTGQNCCLNSTVVDVFLDHEPQPTATKNMVHISQMVRDGNIQMYNYKDENENKKRYGQASPPVYNMSNVPKDLPLYLSYGGADALSDPNDVEHLIQDLGRPQGDHNLVVQYIQNYAHADFVMAHLAKLQVYDPLISFLKLH